MIFLVLNILNYTKFIDLTKIFTNFLYLYKLYNEFLDKYVLYIIPILTILSFLFFIDNCIKLLTFYLYLNQINSKNTLILPDFFLKQIEYITNNIMEVEGCDEETLKLKIKKNIEFYYRLTIIYICFFFATIFLFLFIYFLLNYLK